jgi:hypothetical protein
MIAADATQPAEMGASVAATDAALDIYNLSAVERLPSTWTP